MLRATGTSDSGHTGPTWRYDYSAATPKEAGTTTVIAPDSDMTPYTHNANGEVTKVTDALGHSRHTKYTNHLVQTATDAMGTGADGTGGNTTAYGWDSRNNATSAKLPTGATASVSAYQTVAGTDLPNDFTSTDERKDTFKYDTNGNTMSVTTSGSAGAAREYTYNKATPTCGGFEGQRCTAKDGNGKVTSFTYDGKDNLAKVAAPAPLGDTTYTYDALGRVKTVTDGRGIHTVYGYDTRDRVKEASSTNRTVSYSYDGDGNIETRTDASGTTQWDYDELSREKVRTLQNGAQTALAYTPGGDVDYYTDPTGKTDYTWDKAGRLDYLTDPAGKKTDFDYDNNDKRTETAYPGGTTQSFTLDKSGRPSAVKTTSGTTTLIDRTYSYASAGKDTTKIRTRTDNLTKLRTSYTYDSQDRLSYALETDSAGARTASWLYCWDKAGNLTSQDGTAATCPGSAVFTYNDASQLTSQTGSATPWSCDKIGNETAGGRTLTTARTNETWTDHSQLSRSARSRCGKDRARRESGDGPCGQSARADTHGHGCSPVDSRAWTWMPQRGLLVGPGLVGATPKASTVAAARRNHPRPIRHHGTIPSPLTCRYMQCLGRHDGTEMAEFSSPSRSAPGRAGLPPFRPVRRSEPTDGGGFEGDEGVRGRNEST
ncbi:hypothetical protein [Streptomyces turgidiscabies]|uniref:hypothetical protein n=1 Tax=Streptomyces turgidiscabies TaxID=85558 RepID=UPI0038F60EEC